MKRIKMLSHISIDPEICHGTLCLRGLRHPVENVLDWLADGMTTDEILADSEDLEREDNLAVPANAGLTQVTRVRRLIAKGARRMPRVGETSISAGQSR